MTRRQGFTLVEMLAALAATSVILATAALVISSMFRVSEHTNRSLRWRATMDQLSDRLRHDAHRASLARVDSGRDDQLVLELPEQMRIEYHRVEGRLERIVFRGEQLDHRDHWLVEASRSMRFQVADEGRFDVVTLVIGPRGDDRGSRHSEQIVAVVGWDQRFQPANVSTSASPNYSSAICSEALATNLMNNPG